MSTSFPATTDFGAQNLLCCRSNTGVPNTYATNPVIHHNMTRDLPADIWYPHIPPQLARYNISLSEFISAHPDYPYLVVGALILRNNHQTDETEILLLKRASTDFCPNVWEPPGGSVDAEDESILHAIVREVWEETGLRITGYGAGRVVRDNAGEEYHRRRSKEKEEEFTEVTFLGKRGEKWCKFNFLVEVQPDEIGELRVELDEMEHQDVGWFDEDAVKRLPFVSEQGREIVLNAMRS